ncbi:arabinose efflux permease family protein [Rhizobium leguminosarum bv. trifolii WSM597]|uniref:Arabinose efflux permease family protein n=1 Tax=Rhizobium leguminosarum bv. trifolii WSM597 TaxID=754764 RepID=I9NGD1_RHILT|nr:MFS transporter [Rhizobium leguminosarum]EJB07004.1 arabinose efflux permease family protein [Rhizobium leguminosarum bv. trifolii WSM597]
MATELSQKASFWVAAGIVAHTLWTSAAPAMAYPLYAGQWHLTPTITTTIFAIYPIVVVATLITFGDLSDHIGRRMTMLYGLMASIAGVFLFAIATDVWMLFVGRVFMGLGVGLSAGPSTAALVDYAGKDGTERASSMTISGQAVGFAASLLVGGLLIQYAPFPTHLSFLVLLFLLVILSCLTYFLPRDTNTVSGQWKPRLPRVERSLRRPFIVSAITVMTAYTHGVTVGSLGSQFAHELVQSSNAFVNSIALSLFGVSLGITGLLSRRVDPSKAAILGTVISIGAMVLLAGAAMFRSLALFIAMAAASGTGYALMVYGGLAIITGVTPKDVRGGVLSGVFLFAYLFTGILAVILGKVATLSDLAHAAFAEVLVMSALCLVTLILLVAHARRGSLSTSSDTCATKA